MQHHDADTAQAARLRAMSVAELKRQIAECVAEEEKRGKPNKARRSWKLAKQDAQAELARRSESAA